MGVLLSGGRFRQWGADLSGRDVNCFVFSKCAGCLYVAEVHLSLSAARGQRVEVSGSLCDRWVGQPTPETSPASRGSSWPLGSRGVATECGGAGARLRTHTRTRARTDRYTRVNELGRAEQGSGVDQEVLCVHCRPRGRSLSGCACVSLDFQCWLWPRAGPGALAAEQLPPPQPALAAPASPCARWPAVCVRRHSWAHPGCWSPLGAASLSVVK